MTTTRVPSTASHPDHTRRRTTLGLLAAGTVVVVTIAIVVALGWVPLPAMPTLAQQPLPPVAGQIAFVHGTWDRPCVAVTDLADGTTRELECGAGSPMAVAWTTDGDVAVAAWDEYEQRPGDLVVRVLDPQSGVEVDERTVSEADAQWATDRRVRADGARLLVPADRDGAVDLRVRAGDGATTDLLHLDGPRDYGLVAAQWSPDGAWVLGLDTRGRLFVLGADGDPAPRLVTDVGEHDAGWTAAPAWWMDQETGQRVDLAP
jgi:Tol biopolymer transport system component